MTKFTHEVLGVSYSTTSKTEDSLWLAIEQAKEKSDTVTTEDVAEVIDTIFGLEPCKETDTSETQTVNDSGDVETDLLPVDESISSTTSYNICEINENGCIVQLLIFRSDNSLPYEVELEAGSYGIPKIVSETVKETITIDKSTTAKLSKPVKKNFTIVPTTPIRYRRKLIPKEEFPDIIEFEVKNDTITFGKETSGVFDVTYFTEYEVVPITLPLDEKLVPQDVLAVVTYMGLMEQNTMTFPELDPGITTSNCDDRNGSTTDKPDKPGICYNEVMVTELCECTEDIHGSYTVKERCACPKGSSSGVVKFSSRKEYVDCGERSVFRGHILDDPETYKLYCCVDPTRTLPKCQKKYATYLGGKPIERGEAAWIRDLGPDTVFVPLLPESGICGKWTIETDVTPKACCVDRLPLSWDEDHTIDTIGPNSYGMISVEGNAPLYYFRSLSNHLFFDEARTKKTLVTPNKSVLVFSSNACGSLKITVTDYCTDLAKTIRSTEGDWEISTVDYNYYDKALAENMGEPVTFNISDEILNLFYGIDGEIVGGPDQVGTYVMQAYSGEYSIREQMVFFQSNVHSSSKPMFAKQFHPPVSNPEAYPCAGDWETLCALEPYWGISTAGGGIAFPIGGGLMLEGGGLSESVEDFLMYCLPTYLPDIEDQRWRVNRPTVLMPPVIHLGTQDNPLGTLYYGGFRNSPAIRSVGFYDMWMCGDTDPIFGTHRWGSRTPLYSEVYTWDIYYTANLTLLIWVC